MKTKSKVYLKKCDKLVSAVTNLMNILYKGDEEMLGGVAALLSDLTFAEPREEFVDGMLGFMVWADNRPEVKSGSVLTTLIHDLGEFSRNRHENWFHPRTAGYTKYLSEAVPTL